MPDELLTREKIIELRSSGSTWLSYKLIAEKYSITPLKVKELVNGKSYKKVAKKPKRKVSFLEALDTLYYPFIEKTETCWIWKGNGDSNKYDYGRIRYQSKVYITSRVALFLVNGKWPTEACHKCDNPPCVRPDHLFDGTHEDNMKDAKMKRKLARLKYAESMRGVII